VSYRTSWQTILPATVIPPDVDEYIRCCEWGTFYESFMEPGETRDQIKDQFWIAFFGKNQIRSDLKRRFEERYPSVARMVAVLKRKEYQCGLLAEPNSLASRFAQTPQLGYPSSSNQEPDPV
jgi:hypothetical protein